MTKGAIRKRICRAGGILMLIDLGASLLQGSHWVSFLLFPVANFIAIGAALGLILYRRWGFWAAYLLAGVSLLALPFPLLSFLWKLVGIDPAGHNLLNRIVLLSAIVPVHIAARRAGDFGPPSESSTDDFTFQVPRRRFSLAGPASPASFWGLLAAGALVVLLPFAAYFLGCFSSDWGCSGDGMGGIMMVYGIGLFIPQLVAFALTFCKLASIAALHYRKLSLPRKVGLVLYFLIAAVSVDQAVIKNFLHFEFVVRRTFAGIPFSRMDTSSSVTGPDLNRNEIRDDLEPIIEEDAHPHRRALNRRAAQVWHRLLGSNTPEEFNATAGEMLWLTGCMGLDAPALWRDMEMMNGNTLARFTQVKEAHSRINQGLPSASISIPPALCRDLSPQGTGPAVIK